MDSLLKMSEVRVLVGGFTASSIYNWIRAGLFPKPLKIGPRSVRWKESEVLEFIEKQAKAAN